MGEIGVGESSHPDWPIGITLFLSAVFPGF